MNKDIRAVLPLLLLGITCCHSAAGDSAATPPAGVASHPSDPPASGHAASAPAPAHPTLTASAAATPIASVATPPRARVGAAPAPDSDDTVEERLRFAGLKPKPTEEFLNNLKGLVASGSRAGVCALASYPLAVNSARGHQKVASEAACQSGYERIFAPRVVEAITNQRFAALQGGSSGVMIGDGDVWFSGICEDDKCQRSTIKMTAINVSQ